MTFDEFFAEAKRLKCRMVSDDPAEVRAALDAKDANIELLRAALSDLVSRYDQRLPLRERPEFWDAARAALKA